MLYSRRNVALEQDIRHAYATMKSLIQAEEKVKIGFIEFILIYF
jgi:hypothetical protein